jgi:hypothetical protein
MGVATLKRTLEEVTATSEGATATLKGGGVATLKGTMATAERSNAELVIERMEW